MSSQTAYTAASSGGQKKRTKKRRRITQIYMSTYDNRLFVEEGLGHKGTVTATRGGKHKEKEHRQAAKNKTKNKKHYSDIDTPYTYVSSST